MVTELLYKLVQRSDDQWYSQDRCHEDHIQIGYSGYEDRVESVRSILQQSGVKLSEVETLREHGVVTDVVLDDYYVGLKLDLKSVLRHGSWSREQLELW
jgi:hypothetical protein